MNTELFLTKFCRTPLSDWKANSIQQKYRIEDKIGAGKYGTVYRARNIETNQLVALKRINQDKEAHGFPKTAMREINLLRSLKHKNIVELSEVITLQNEFVTGDNAFLVLGYMEHDFQSLMRTVHFDLPQIKYIMQQILEGLHYLHENNVYHRDLKPNNILYNNQGEVRICDFGMASKYRMLQTPRILIPQYRPPEIYLGKHYTTKVDIWSAGIFFMELCLGKDKGPFIFAQSDIQCFHQICEKFGTPTEDNWPGVTQLAYYHELVPENATRHPRSLRSYLLHCGSRQWDPLLLDLLDGMLTLNPEERISAKGALNHELFVTYPLPAVQSDMPKLELECNGQNCFTKQRSQKKSQSKSKGQQQQQKQSKEVMTTHHKQARPPPIYIQQMQQQQQQMLQQQNEISHKKQAKFDLHFNRQMNKQQLNNMAPPRGYNIQMVNQFATAKNVQQYFYFNKKD